uniref:Chemokine (C-C motif) ligand 20a, duplicate 3 n=1 Tax=Sinocyclocheilus grahami TaxID=75366 RepID=A0A672RUE6_SINGR
MVHSLFQGSKHYKSVFCAFPLADILCVLPCCTCLTDRADKKIFFLKYTKGQVPMAIIKGYSIQTMTRNCHIDAVIFHTKEGRNICTDSEQYLCLDIRYGRVYSSSEVI